MVAGRNELEGISDIRISGIDETRPQHIRNESYIILYYKLNHKAPILWCEDFNRLVKKKKYPAKIMPSTCQIIETWVRNADEIATELDSLKEAVNICNQEYIARIVQAKATTPANESGNSETQLTDPWKNKSIVFT